MVCQHVSLHMLLTLLVVKTLSIMVKFVAERRVARAGKAIFHSAVTSCNRGVCFKIPKGRNSLAVLLMDSQTQQWNGASELKKKSVF